MLAAGEIDILSDVTSLWAALGGYVRDPVTGLYPIRLADDPALILARYLQAVAVRQGLDDGAAVAVTTSRRNRVERWRDYAQAASVPFRVRTVDPGLETVTQRLSDDSGALSEACEQAIRRWYG